MGIEECRKDLTVFGMESIKHWHDISGSPAMGVSAAKHQGSNGWPLGAHPHDTNRGLARR
jgi:hypothetical protein